jgi:hypothetical protein
MIDLLSSRHAALAAKAGRAAPAEITVVFDAGQNSASNFAHVTDTGLAFVALPRGETYRRWIARAARPARAFTPGRGAWEGRVLDLESALLAGGGRGDRDQGT